MGDYEKQYGWGLIGPGRFAREFAEELGDVERARLVAVASRSQERAESFARDFGFERTYTSYEDLIDDSDVDIVYIVLPHVFHREVAEKALAAGKAVVCEKPLTPSSRETGALIEFAKERGTFLMEAMKTGFLPAVRLARDWIEQGAIGEVRLAKADFCFQGPEDPSDRLMNPELAGGAVLDVGIYPLYLVRFLLGEVEKVSSFGTLASTGVEDSAAILTAHTSGASSALTCSFRTAEHMDAVILGTDGEIRIPTFHAAKTVELYKDGFLYEQEEFPDCGMVRPEIEAVMKSLDEGKVESQLHSHKDTLRLAEIMDEVRDQLGAKRPE